MVIVVFLLYLIVGAVEVIPLVEKPQKFKALALYFALWGIALVVSELLLLEISLPSPADPINHYANWIKDLLGG